jgi:hypothetical protein
MQAPFLYLNVYLSVMLDNLSCSFTSIYFLTTSCSFTITNNPWWFVPNGSLWTGWSLPNYYVYHYLGIIELLFTLIIACKLMCDDEYTQIVD